MADYSVEPSDFVSLNSELLNAAGFVRLGVFGLSSLSIDHTFGYYPLLLLSQGAERLTKVAAMLGCVLRTGEWPEAKTVSRIWGHKLYVLVEEVVQIARTGTYLARSSAARDDVAFLSESELCARVVSLLAGFGGGGRYSNLDAIVDPERVRDCERELEGIKEIVGSTLPPLDFADAKACRRRFRELNGRIIAVVQRLCRAVSRLFTLGPLAPVGKQISNPLFDLLILRDETLHLPWGQARQQEFDVETHVNQGREASTIDPEVEKRRAVRLVWASINDCVRRDLEVRIGRLRGGLAILVGGDGAFWVKDCAVFAGNGIAMTWAQGVSLAPVGIDIDAISRAADSVVKPELARQAGALFQSLISKLGDTSSQS